MKGAKGEPGNVGEPGIVIGIDVDVDSLIYLKGIKGRRGKWSGICCIVRSLPYYEFQRVPDHLSQYSQNKIQDYLDN